LQQPYSELADVYSFGILLWEISALEMPYSDTPEGDIERKVIRLGVRPKIDPAWPNPIRRLMQDLFANKYRRPKMDVVCDVLMKEINTMARKKLVDYCVEESARSALSDRYYS
jgi:serine/threonine protein kinase